MTPLDGRTGIASNSSRLCPWSGTEGRNWGVRRSFIVALNGEIEMLWECPINIGRSKARLWRYMSFSAYVWLLQTKSLYFSRLDRFGDTCKGTPTLNRRKWLTEKRKSCAAGLLKYRRQLEAFLDVQLPEDVSVWPRLDRIRDKRYGREVAAICGLAEARQNEVQFVEDISRIHRECEKEALSATMLRRWRMCNRAEGRQLGLLSVEIRGDRDDYANC